MSPAPNHRRASDEQMFVVLDDIGIPQGVARPYSEARHLLRTLRAMAPYMSYTLVAL